MQWELKSNALFTHDTEKQTSRNFDDKCKNIGVNW